VNTICLPSGKITSQIGLGCGVLVGGLSARLSRKMVETALQLGITHFDVAPLYGMGLAENVIGEVIGNDPRITIATKVGIARPRYNYLEDDGRLLTRGLLRRYPSLKQKVLTIKRTQPQPTTERTKNAFLFVHQAIQHSLEESLLRLKRDNLEWLLAHEPEPHALDAAARAAFEFWVDKSVIASYGVGSVRAGMSTCGFGKISQSSWQNNQSQATPDDMFLAHFGVIRGASGGKHGVNVSDAARESLRAAMAQRPNDLILVSAGAPQRLRQLLKGLV
jgi:predicted oxidoreductase